MMWRNEDSAVTCLLALLTMRIWVGDGVAFLASVPRRVLRAAVGL